MKNCPYICNTVCECEADCQGRISYSKSYSVCNGKIENGRCNKCFNIPSSSSAYCSRLVQVFPEEIRNNFSPFDLMIGNYALCNGLRVKIDSHYYKEIVSQNIQFTFEPLLMTEEWHNKFGVYKDGFGNFEYATKRLQRLTFSGGYVYIRDYDSIDGNPSIKDSIVCIWNDDFAGRGMYVHEFQNMYKLLTGINISENE